MSIGGPSPLGTLLVQRLDAMLGTTLSQQANVVSGARPDAVTQPGNPERPDPARNETQRHPQDAVDRATAQNEQHGRGAIDKARLDARSAAWLLARNAPNTATTPSAPTTLGQAAKTILALLANYPEQTAAVQGRRPLLTGQPGAEARTGSSPEQNGSTAAGRGGMAGTSSGAASSASANVSAQSGATGALPGAAGGAPGAVGGAAAAVSGASATAGNGLIASQLAQSLAQTVRNSGMFYESHLSNLTFGKHALADLMQEPQAQAGRSTTRGDAQAPNSASTSTGTSTGAETSAPRGAGESAPQAAASARGSDAGGTQGAAPNPASTLPPSSPLNGLDPQTHVLVRQQLEVLANQSFAWRGEAWPGTPMDWEISRREPSQDADGQPQTEHWATRLTINLPQLGEVQARLTLSGQQLVMHLLAPDSADVLREHSEGLRGRFSAQGLQLSQLSVAAQETASDPTAESIDKTAADAADAP